MFFSSFNLLRHLSHVTVLKFLEYFQEVSVKGSYIAYFAIISCYWLEGLYCSCYYLLLVASDVVYH